MSSRLFLATFELCLIIGEETFEVAYSASVANRKHPTASHVLDP